MAEWYFVHLNTRHHRGNLEMTSIQTVEPNVIIHSSPFQDFSYFVLFPVFWFLLINFVSDCHLAVSWKRSHTSLLETFSTAQLCRSFWILAEKNKNQSWAPHADRTPSETGNNLVMSLSSTVIVWCCAHDLNRLI